jgi:hypothetical protein
VKKLTMALAAGMLLSLVGMVHSQATNPASMPVLPALGQLPVTGRLVKVIGNNLVIDAGRVIRNTPTTIAGSAAGGRRVIIAPPAPGEPNEVTVVTDDRTQFDVNYEIGTLGDLKPGMSIIARLGPLPDNQPVRLFVAATSASLMGIVVKLDGQNVIVRVTQPDGQRKDVTVGADEKTRVVYLGGSARDRTGLKLVPGQVGQLADLEPGTRVKVFPETGLPEKIVIGGKGPAPADIMPATRPTSRPG